MSKPLRSPTAGTIKRHGRASHIFARLTNTGRLFTGGLAVLQNVDKRANALGLEIANLRGTIEDLARLNSDLVAQVRLAAESAHESAVANNSLEERVAHASDKATSTIAALSGSKQEADIMGLLQDVLGKIQTLSNGVLETAGALDSVQDIVANVQRTSDEIQNISFETQLIALNARVEAARAGEAGRGFAVIADSIKSLAEQVKTFTTDNTAQLSRLSATIAGMSNSVRGNSVVAGKAIEESNAATAATKDLQAAADDTRELAEIIGKMVAPINENIGRSSAISDRFDVLVGLAENVDSELSQARARSEQILTISEQLILFVAESGARNEDAPIISASKRIAGHISEAFHKSLNKGEINERDLFDDNYVPIAGSNPPQFITRFTQLTDAILPAIIEPALKENERIVFCAAVDQNGYLPTHNSIYSHPQGLDPVWNAAHCRNRRIFDDRTSLNAGRSTRPFLLQTYRRDMGEGRFVLMKDASAPIIVNGKHWGGLRIAFKA